MKAHTNPLQPNTFLPLWMTQYLSDRVFYGFAQYNENQNFSKLLTSNSHRVSVTPHLYILNKCSKQMVAEVYKYELMSNCLFYFNTFIGV